MRARVACVSSLILTAVASPHTRKNNIRPPFLRLCFGWEWLEQDHWLRIRPTNVWTSA